MQLDLVEGLSTDAGKAKSKDALRTISEVADELDVPQHVLRFWESKFPQISPMKRRGGRRYYRPRDVEILHAVKKLLYEEGYTIRGASKFISSALRGKAEMPQPAEVETEVEAKEAPSAPVREPNVSDLNKELVRSVLNELQTLRRMLG